MSRRLASNYSTYWPICGLKKICMDFTEDRLNPYATTPPQVIRTLPISRQQRLVPQNQLHRCVPFVDVITWTCFVSFSVFSWFYFPKVECYAFIWNQHVYTGNIPLVPMTRIACFFVVVREVFGNDIFDGLGRDGNAT